MSDTYEIRLIMDAVINLYAAHVHSLLYPYDHPLISDSLKNAFSCLQKSFRRRSIIRLDTFEGGLMVDGEVIKGDIFVLNNFASLLKSRNIKALSFAKDLSRRELISFHKIISTTKVGGEELSRAMSDKSITNITAHLSEFSASDAGPVSPQGEAGGRFVKDYVDTMFHIESKRAQDPFFLRNPGAGPYDGGDSHGLVKDYISTSFQAWIHELPPLDKSSIRKGDAQQAGDVHYAEYVEGLIEHEISENEQGLIRTVPPHEMAHLLNAMLFGPPSHEVVDRILKTYLGRAEELRAEDNIERYKIFIEALRHDIRPLFEGRWNSLFYAGNLFADKETGILPEAAQVMHVSPQKEDNAGIPYEQTAFVPCRTLENCDFVFDFVANGKAVLHDIEITGKNSSLFKKEHLSYFQDEGVLDKLSSGISDAAANAETYSKIIAECTNEAVSDAFFDVMLDLLESDSLDGEAFWKLEKRIAALVEIFLEKSEFEKILEVLNCLKTHSLQGKFGTQASAMLRNIFSSDRLNEKVVEALKQHGRKRKESAFRLTVGLRSYLVPYLLDALIEETDTSTRRFMMALLTSAGNSVLDHIARRLRDSRWYVLRNMLYLLRECRGQSYASEVKDFLDHEVPVVCLEALRTLLSFQDPDADSYVIKFLRSEVFQLQMGAIRLAGAYRIKNSAPHLIRLLKQKDVPGKKSIFRKSIIRALGRIGDGNAVGNLLDICKSKSVFRKDEADHLKIEIFRMLHNYPAATIGPLIDYGMQSNNKEILAICRKLAKKYGVRGKTEVKV
jgi:hypothetical protein